MLHERPGIARGHGNFLTSRAVFRGENRPADRGKSDAGAIRPVRFLPGICHHQLGQLVRCCSDNAEHLSVNQKYVDAFLQNLGNTLG